MLHNFNLYITEKNKNKKTKFDSIETIALCPINNELLLYYSLTLFFKRASIDQQPRVNKNLRIYMLFLTGCTMKQKAMQHAPYEKNSEIQTHFFSQVPHCVCLSPHYAACLR